MDIPASHQALLERPLTAVFTTIGSDGAPHSAPIWYLLEEGLLKVVLSDDRQKARNIGRDARVSITIVDPESPLTYVEIRGVATLMPDEGGAVLDRVARAYGYPDGQAFAAPGTGRLVGTIKPTRVLHQ